MSSFNFSVSLLFHNFFFQRPKHRTLKIIEKHVVFACFCTFGICLQLIVWSSKLVWKNHHFGIQTHQKSTFKRIKFINSLMNVCFHDFYSIWEDFDSPWSSEESFARIQLPNNVHKMILSHIKIHYIFFASVHTCISAFNFTFVITFFDNFFIKFPKLQTCKIMKKHSVFRCFYTWSTFLYMIVWFSNFIWKNHNFGIQTYEKSSFKSICAGLGEIVNGHSEERRIWESLGPL